jgi:hypothetical protein
MRIRFQQVAGIRHIDGKRFDRYGARAYRDDAERYKVELLKVWTAVRIIKQGPMHFSLWVHGIRLANAGLQWGGPEHHALVTGQGKGKP